MTTLSRGLRFYRSSVRVERGKGVPIFVHGEIESGRSDFDFIFKCLYERWSARFVLSEHCCFAENDREDVLMHVKDGLIWANGETSLLLHEGSFLPSFGREMPEFDGSILVILRDCIDQGFTWKKFLDLANGNLVEVGDSAAVCGIVHNFDGVYWELFPADAEELEILLTTHRGNKALKMFWVDIAKDYPTPANRSLAEA